MDRGEDAMQSQMFEAEVSLETVSERVGVCQA